MKTENELYWKRSNKINGDYIEEQKQEVTMRLAESESCSSAKKRCQVILNEKESLDDLVDSLNK